MKFLSVELLITNERNGKDEMTNKELVDKIIQYRKENTKITASGLINYIYLNTPPYSIEILTL